MLDSVGVTRLPEPQVAYFVSSVERGDGGSSGGLGSAHCVAGSLHCALLLLRLPQPRPPVTTPTLVPGLYQQKVLMGPTGLCKLGDLAGNWECVFTLGCNWSPAYHLGPTGH